MPHERTLPKAKSDRLELLRATRANLDPIWGLSLADRAVGAAPTTSTASRFATATDEDGFRHALWRINDPGTRRRRSPTTVAGAKLVLADGHHRFETAGNYRDRAPRRGSRRSRRRRDHDPGGRARARPALRARHPPPAHRRRRPSTSATALAGPFMVHAAGPNVPEGVAALETAMRESGGLGLVDRDGLALLAARPPSSRPAWRELPVELRDVDSARFDAGVLPAVPGREPRLPQRRRDRRRRRSRRATPTPRCCCDRSPSTPSAPRPPPICACRRRRRSSRRSRAPAWCSAASTTEAAVAALVDVPGGAGADQLVRGRRDPGARPRRRADAAPRPRRSAAGSSGTRPSAWASSATTTAATARTPAPGRRGSRRARGGGPRRRRRPPRSRTHRTR